MNASCDHAYAASQSGCVPDYGREQESWYRFRIRFPSGYQPTPGTQNTVLGFHVDHTTELDAESHNSFAYSTSIGVQADGDPNVLCPGRPFYCISPGSNPRFFIQVPGGSDLTNSQNAYHPLPTNSLQLGHWYDMVLHVYWSADLSKGHVQWWVDGNKLLDVMTPTLYRRARDCSVWNGCAESTSYVTGIGFYDYRFWARWPSSVDFDELIVGPTANSVGFSG